MRDRVYGPAFMEYALVNSPVTRVSTPNLFSTKTEIVCRIKPKAVWMDKLTSNRVAVNFQK